MIENGNRTLVSAKTRSMTTNYQSGKLSDSTIAAIL